MDTRIQLARCTRAEGGPFTANAIVTYESHVSGLVSVYALFPEIRRCYPDGVMRPAKGVRREACMVTTECFNTHFEILTQDTP